MKIRKSKWKKLKKRVANLEKAVQGQPINSDETRRMIENITRHIQMYPATKRGNVPKSAL